MAGEKQRVRAIDLPPKGIPHRKLKKKRQFSSTPGSTKGLTPSPMQKTYARRNRSYKWPNYDAIMNSLGKRKGAS